MLQGSVATLTIDYVFDLATRGDLDRLFLSGAQIDRYGNTNVTAIGGPETMKVKLPGGGGGAYLSCTAKHATLWTSRHRARTTAKGKLFTLVEAVDFITAVGHRTPQGSRQELALKGGGPQWLITNLGVFDFEPETKTVRLRQLYPDVTLEEVLANTGFAPALYEPTGSVPTPTAEEVAFIRALDPLEVRRREFPAEELGRTFPVAEAERVGAP
jgi:glutaconate CoA-transferase subunit B